MTLGNMRELSVRSLDVCVPLKKGPPPSFESERPKADYYERAAIRMTMCVGPYRRLADQPDATPSHETARRNPSGVQAAARTLKRGAQDPGRALHPEHEQSPTASFATSCQT
jgi:hypothetical protein